MHRLTASEKLENLETTVSITENNDDDTSVYRHKSVAIVDTGRYETIVYYNSSYFRANSCPKLYAMDRYDNISIIQKTMYVPTDNVCDL